MSPRPTHSCRGVTLLEALMALLISSVGLLGLSAVQAQVQRGATQSRQVAQATHHLQQALAHALDPSHMPAPDMPQGLELTVTLETDEGGVAGRLVRGQVLWQDATGVTHHLHLAQVAPLPDARLSARERLSPAGPGAPPASP
ncbi:type IV pilus modification PilV family protein [Inhella gelatinilytica]|uniref:Prepilin-type N-terminal cleavage/methylation domain-containing protein n=1 Tax=Inhella gelatinilytica TaxID=2795030 RepID=A0A931IUG7_9BURK|nr:prepilin-type N-terminal cleavage/methylation domain-containing protein [Inhella gelatinilytica]MBH9552985.1 prepilin-type N-terminal cleavage/methylation domain-containing protein [Inhella gelatinilytica]